MVKALQRAERIAELGVGRVAVDDIPTNRLQVLARTGLGSKATALVRLGEPKRTATLAAVVRRLEAVAVDDTLDLVRVADGHQVVQPGPACLDGAAVGDVATVGEGIQDCRSRRSRAIGRACGRGDIRRSAGHRLHCGRRLRRWRRAPVVAEAIGLVEELVPDDDGSAESAMRAALAGRYNTVRPFLTLLGESAALHAAPGGERVLAAVGALPELARRRVGQKPLADDEIDAELVTPSW